MLADSSLTLHRLAPNRRMLCATPGYLAQHGAPERPEDLLRHACGVLRENQSDESLLRFSHKDKTQLTVRVRPAICSNDGEVMRSWGLASLGVIVRSEWDEADDLAQGRLLQLLPGWRLPDADVVALTGPRSSRTARVVCFLEFLRASLLPTPWRTR